MTMMMNFTSEIKKWIEDGLQRERDRQGKLLLLDGGAEKKKDEYSHKHKNDMIINDQEKNAFF